MNRLKLSNKEKMDHYRLMSQIDEAVKASPDGQVAFVYEGELSENVREGLKRFGINAEPIRMLGNEEASTFLITSKSGRIVETQQTDLFRTWYEEYCERMQEKLTFTYDYEEGQEEIHDRDRHSSISDIFKNMFRKEENDLLNELYPPEEKQEIPIPAWEVCKMLSEKLMDMYEKIKQLELGKKVEKFFEIIENIISRIEEKYAETENNVKTDEKK